VIFTSWWLIVADIMLQYIINIRVNSTNVNTGEWLAG